MNKDKATNTYERMLIEVYNNYLKEVADEETLKEIKKNMTYELINSKIKDPDQMEESIKFHIEKYTYSEFVYMELLSYEKDNDIEKHSEYADFVCRQMKNEMKTLRQYDIPMPISGDVLYPTRRKRVDILFSKAMYEKVQQMIKSEDNYLEFKIEGRNKQICVLLIAGRFKRPLW